MCESVKNDRDDIWLKDLSIVIMDVWARSSEQECVKRLSLTLQYIIVGFLKSEERK